MGYGNGCRLTGSAKSSQCSRNCLLLTEVCDQRCLDAGSFVGEERDYGTTKFGNPLSEQS